MEGEEAGEDEEDMTDSLECDNVAEGVCTGDEGVD